LCISLFFDIYVEYNFFFFFFFFNDTATTEIYTLSLHDALPILVWVRFHEPVDDELRAELTRLVRRRGSAARRAAERVEPIEVVVDDPRGERQRIVGHLEPPQVRHGLLRAIEFELRRSR